MCQVVEKCACSDIDSSCLPSIRINDDIDDISRAWDPSKSESYESYESIDDHIRDRRWSFLSHASTGVESLTDNNKQTDKMITSKEENDVDGGKTFFLTILSVCTLLIICILLGIVVNIVSTGTKNTDESTSVTSVLEMAIDGELHKDSSLADLELVPTAPANIQEICLMANPIEDETSKCEDICNSAECCTDPNASDNCFRENSKNCIQHSICFERNFNAADVKAILVNEVCSSEALTKQSGINSCRAACSEALCCYPEKYGKNLKNTCKAERNADKCNLFLACAALPEIDGNDGESRRLH